MARKKLSQGKKLLKAYKNSTFLNSPAARSLRILSEMVEPADRLSKNDIHDTVVFFGSARTPSMSSSKKQLREVNKKLKNKKKISKKLLFLRQHITYPLRSKLK